MHMYNDIFILKLHITNNNNENDFRHRFLKHLGQMKKKKPQKLLLSVLYSLHKEKVLKLFPHDS